MNGLNELTVIYTADTNPYHNLALEEYLLHTVGEYQSILYLWQNQRTVVIGRNQNAANECRIPVLEADGGHLARRLSGGGAVYHDLGNLNFTFLSKEKNFDVDRQTEVILRGVQAAGVKAERTGRNDLTADGKKFSGHAYYRTGGRCYHHGTLMVQVDKEPLERYLNVAPIKLEAKGVKSVRSRVGNLKDFCPDITVESLARRLIEAFSQVYGLPVTFKKEEDLDTEAIRAGMARFADPGWIYGDTRPMQYSCETRYSWGTVRLDYSLKETGEISEAAIYSDGLEPDYLSIIPLLLKDCTLSENALHDRFFPHEEKYVLTKKKECLSNMATETADQIAPQGKELPSENKTEAAVREEITEDIIRLLVNETDKY